jgi:hypothetical protein
MPCLRNHWNPSGTVIENVEIESYVDMNERRDPILGWPRDVSSCQKKTRSPIRTPLPAAKTPGGDAGPVRFDPNNSGTDAWKEGLDVDVPYGLGAECSGARPQRQSNDQSSHALNSRDFGSGWTGLYGVLPREDIDKS